MGQRSGSPGGAAREPARSDAGIANNGREAFYARRRSGVPIHVAELAAGQEFLNVPEILNVALQQHRAGDLAGAEALYRQILAEQPRCADALYLMGVVARQTGRFEEAIEFIQRAVADKNSVPEYYLDLGAALHALNRSDEALAAYHAAISIRLNYAEAHVNQGNVLAA